MQLTPMLKQYMDVKQTHPDEILFFRLGDFYEMFFEDAKIASRELEITLTKRSTSSDVPMCGVPYHAAENYINKLVSKGYKVAICEQIGDPKAKGLTKREVVKIITPGTVMSEDILTSNNNNYIALVYEEGPQVYLAGADISTGECFYAIYEGTDRCQMMYDELYRLMMPELLIVEPFSFTDKIKRFVENRLNGCLINTIPEVSKNVEDRIIQHFDEHNRPDNNGAKNAIATLLDYLHDTVMSDLSHLNKLTYLDASNCLFIDTYTLRNLEITRNLRDGGKRDTLYHVLDFTKTSMGSRTLRKWLEYPLLSIDQINLRLESVESFLNNFSVRQELREILKQVYDFERLLTRIEVGTANARDINALKSSLQALPFIKAAVGGLKTEYIAHLGKHLDTFDELVEAIDRMIVEDPGFSIREGGFIREGYNAELDEYRNIAHNSKRLLQDMEEREKEKTGIKSLKIGYNKVFGYYLEVRNASKDLVPDNYIRKQTLANAERFITEELKEFETKILGAQEKIVQIEYNLFVELRDKLKAQIAPIQDSAQQVAIIDVLVSMAQAAEEYNYVRPELVEGGVIDIKDGRHPLVERILQKEVFVPNDTYLDNEQNEIIVITGPNMAGKSTYMRQTALLTLMAQVGSFIPAREAKISPVDKIFTRIGASDNLVSGESTFMVEMNEVAHILKYATTNSLVILDEIGRGTSTYDGMSIARSVIEYIRDHVGAKTLFATHYHELTDLEDSTHVKNYCVAVKEKGNEVNFLRRIIPGCADKSYGIHVAKLAGLPSLVINRAEHILKDLEQDSIDLNMSRNKGEKTASQRTVNAVANYEAECLLAANEVAENDASDDQEGKNCLKFLEIEEMPTLFGVSISTQLKELDLMSMTPLEAMNKLYELQQQAKEE